MKVYGMISWDSAIYLHIIGGELVNCLNVDRLIDLSQFFVLHFRAVARSRKSDVALDRVELVCRVWQGKL